MTTPSAPADSPAAIWDLDLQRRFPPVRHGDARSGFELRVRLRSDAGRVVLVGPSGAGKSQTLRMVAGLARPDAGHVRLRGRPLVDRAQGIDVPARDRGLGLVFQDYALFPHLSVAQNVAFGLQPARWRNPPAASAAADPRVQRWLQRFELGPVANHLPAQLSGGQRQRTAIARALAPAPAALLLDEPFAALDPALRARLRDELLDLQQALGLPLILITHDDADAHRLGEAVFVLRDGRVLGGA